jgi:hypothetical protein
LPFQVITLTISIFIHNIIIANNLKFQIPSNWKMDGNYQIMYSQVCTNALKGDNHIYQMCLRYSLSLINYINR